jgi:hypothetical protein
MQLEDKFRRRIRAAANFEELAQPLEELLSGRYSVWYDGRLYEIKALVERIKDLRIEVRPREHIRPHFHAIGQNFSASFDLDTCDLLEGRIDPIHHRLVRIWHKDAKGLLRKRWNETRTLE